MIYNGLFPSNASTKTYRALQTPMKLQKDDIRLTYVSTDCRCITSSVSQIAGNLELSNATSPVDVHGLYHFQ